MRKIGIPLHTLLLLYNCWFKGVFIARTCFLDYLIWIHKEEVGNDLEMAQSERNNHSKNQGGKN